MKRPAFQFYPGDWQRDAALRSCSVGARGLWIEMICLMHQAEPYGHLVVNGRPINDQTIARMVGAKLGEVVRWLHELENAGVFDREGETIVSRRMVRDEALRKVRADGGKLGGNPALMDKAKDGDKVNLPANHQPTPSSSSSSSSSKDQKRVAASGARPQKPRKTPLQDNFGISERVTAWAKEKGHDRLPDHLESFKSKCRKKGYEYVDWDEAFMEAVRENWAKLPAATKPFAPIKRLCEEEISPGNVCGMPGEQDGGRIRCAHHSRIRREASGRPMPEFAKKALSEFKAKGAE